jgi:hypothetical protein
MRGDDLQQGAMFSYLSPEQRVPADHPLRPIRQMVDAVLKRLSPLFDAMYAERGRPSIPPERLLSIKKRSLRTEYVARRGGRAIDQRTTRYPGYLASQTKRKRVEEIFGWFKTIGRPGENPPDPFQASKLRLPQFRIRTKSSSAPFETVQSRLAFHPRSGTLTRSSIL